MAYVGIAFSAQAGQFCSVRPHLVRLHNFLHLMRVGQSDGTEAAMSHFLISKCGESYLNQVSLPISSFQKCELLITPSLFSQSLLEKVSCQVKEDSFISSTMSLAKLAWPRPRPCPWPNWLGPGLSEEASPLLLLTSLMGPVLLTTLLPWTMAGPVLLPRQIKGLLLLAAMAVVSGVRGLWVCLLR